MSENTFTHSMSQKHILPVKKGILGKVIYPVRVAGYVLATISILSVQWFVKGQISLLAWIFILIFNIYPHLAFGIYKYKNQARQVEFFTLLVDMFWIGWITNLVYFAPTIFLPYFVTNSATNYAVNGLKACLQGIAFYLAGGFIAFLFHQEMYQAIQLPDLYVLPGFVYLTAGSHYIGLLSHWRGSVLRKTKAAIEAQNTELSQQKTNIEQQKYLLEKHNHIIQNINQNLKDSIAYAQQIQHALLPLEQDLRKFFSDYFVLFKPRDVVSGDFYFFHTENHLGLLAVIDCVGHGIPGAFLSLLTHQMMQNIIYKGILLPDLILMHLHQDIRRTLQQGQNDNRDGLDAAICLIEPQKNKLSYAGAKNPLLYFEDHEMHLVGATRHSVGGDTSLENLHFDRKVIALNTAKKTTFYLFTDGYADQFGGQEKKKLGKKQFKELLAQVHSQPLSEQKKKLERYLQHWIAQGREHQIDDILIVGFQV